MSDAQEARQPSLHKDPYGVGGWLALFVVGLIFLGPVLSLSSTASELASTERLYPNLIGNDDWDRMKAITWIGAIAHAALIFAAGLRLSKFFTPSSVRFAVFTLWFAAVGLPVIQFFVITSTTRLSIETMMPDLARWIGQGLLWAMVWNAYLVRSKRVKNTYYSSQIIAGGLTSKLTIGDRWRSLPVSRRKAVFFSGAWIMLVVIWAKIFDEDTTQYFQGGWGLHWEKVWTWALLPPGLYIVFRWAYTKFVIADSDKDPA